MKVQGNPGQQNPVFFSVSITVPIVSRDSGEQCETFWHCAILLLELQSHSSDCDWPGLKEIDSAAGTWIWSAPLISLV